MIRIMIMYNIPLYFTPSPSFFQIRRERNRKAISLIKEKLIIIRFYYLLSEDELSRPQIDILFQKQLKHL